MSRARVLSMAAKNMNRAAARMARPNSVGTLRLGRIRSYTCSMKNDPVSMRILAMPRIRAAAMNADRQDLTAPRSSHSVGLVAGDTVVSPEFRFCYC
jgi:hypothetical protein